MFRPRWSLSLLLLTALSGFSASAEPIGPGNGERTADLPGLKLQLFTYRPSCDNPAILMVLHGLNRNADRYRQHARSLGDRLCMIVVAPLFDKERFPTWRYQRGGIVNHRKVQPSNEWTGRLVLEVVAWVRQQEGRQAPYSMIGHSAGGQFLSRLAAFTPTDARRIVIANPSTHVFAQLETKAPFGFGGVYPSKTATSELRRYLQAPVTIFLGQEDTGDEDRNDSAEARAQGETRHERGLNAFRSAQALAKSKGWTFNWRLVELPGTGHSAAKMFSSKQAVEALSP